MKGVVQIAEILSDATGVEKVGIKAPKDFMIRMHKKSYQLQCEEVSDVQEWIDAITSWIMHCSADD